MEKYWTGLESQREDTKSVRVRRTLLLGMGRIRRVTRRPSMSMKRVRTSQPGSSSMVDMGL